MRPVWLHDLRLAWRHSEIRREVIELTAWKAAFWVAAILFLPLILPVAITHVAGAALIKAAEVAENILAIPFSWVRSRRTPYYRLITDKLTAKGAMQWQIKGEAPPRYSDSPRADG